MNNTEVYKGWCTTYTLLGILRAPNHFRDFVSIRSLYEGGDMGEGIIKSLRPLCPTGIHDGWSLNLIENYYCRNVFTHLLTSVKAVKTPTNKLSTIDNISTSFVRYGSKVELQHKIEHGNIFSVMFFKDISTQTTIIGSMIKHSKEWYLCPISIDSTIECVLDEIGFTYFVISLTNTEYEMTERNTPFNSVHNILLWNVGLAIPCYWSNGPRNTFAFITEDGYTLSQNLDWILIT